MIKCKPDHLLEISPKGTVPVLYLEDRTVIEESREIMRWALQNRDPLQLLQRVDASTIDIFDTTFKFHLDRYKYAYRYKNKEDNMDGEGETSRGEEIDHRELCMHLLTDLETRLSHGQGWLSGADPGFTDVALLPFVRQFRIADEKFFESELKQRIPFVYDWLHQFLCWPPFLHVMVKFAPWNQTRLHFSNQCREREYRLICLCVPNFSL